MLKEKLLIWELQIHQVNFTKLNLSIMQDERLALTIGVLEIRASFWKWCSFKGQVWFSSTVCDAHFIMLPLSNLIEMELDRGLENDCGCTFIATVEAFSILLTTDFISTQQKLSSVFTMESDCPERIGQMEHFKTLTIKRREINRDLETNTKTKEEDKRKRQRKKTKTK